MSSDYQTSFICTDSVEGILTGLYEAYASRISHRQLCLELEERYSYRFFYRYVHVAPDAAKAEKVRQSILRRISPAAWQLIYRAMLSGEASKADDIFRYLRGGYHFGAKSLSMIAEPPVARLMELNRHVSGEAHYYREFIRFEFIGGQFLLGRIRPKNNILTLLAPHFADRLGGEQFVILDTLREEAVIHPRDSRWFLSAISEKELREAFPASRDCYVDLWKTFFDSIAIGERSNPLLQRSMLPLRYRTYMPEFDRT